MPMRGAKWMREATYLTEADRAKIMAEVKVAKATLKECGGDQRLDRTVGVRPAAYIGEPHPIAAIVYGRGGCSLWGFVYN